MYVKENGQLREKLTCNASLLGSMDWQAGILDDALPIALTSGNDGGICQQAVGHDQSCCKGPGARRRMS